MALLAVGDLVGFIALYYLTVRTVDGRLLSDASLRGALSTSGLVGAIDAVLDVVSVASLLATIAAVAMIALVRLDRIRGLAAIGVLVAANLSTLVLKDYLLARPDLGLNEVAPATLNSLPSGHATAAFSAVVALLFVVPRRWRLVVVTLGAGYAALTGVATMLAGWHRAADSIAAFLLVGLLAAVAAAACVFVPSPGRRTTVVAQGERLSVRWFGAASVGCLAVGGLIALALLRASSVRESSVGSWIAFLGAALLITGSVLGVLIGVLRTLDRVDAIGVRAPAG